MHMHTQEIVMSMLGHSQEDQLSYRALGMLCVL